jgi:hypothetical protein
MATIYRDRPQKVRVLQSEKTAYPIKRFLAPGVSADAIQQGELVGLRPTASMTMVAERITDANQHAQAKNALMRANTTTNDQRESGAVTCLEGLYLLETSLYLAGTYAVGDYVTARFDSALGFGVFGTVHGSSTHVLGQVVVAPQNGTAKTPMVLKIYPQPIPKPA